MIKITSVAIVVSSFLLLLHICDILINRVTGKAIHVVLVGFNSHQLWHS